MAIENFIEIFIVFYKSVYGVILIPLEQFLRSWWWFILPFLLKDFFAERWLWWRNENWLKQRYHPVMLELKIPNDNLKPIRAMETVMANIHAAIYLPSDPWEKWIEGQVQTSVALEIVSIGGEIHFYVRANSDYKNAIEAAFYGQFPNLEIIEVEDYTKKVPLNIPNKDWDLWGTGYRAIRKEWGYPIKTYKDFETERESIEEQKIDPVAGLLEALSKVGPEEQLWIQISIKPVGADSGSTWISDALELRDRLAKRPEKVVKKDKPILLEATNILIGLSDKKEEKKPEPILPPEMKMTPGERDVVAAIENKASKQGFESFIRYVFLGKRRSFNKSNLRLPFVYFSSYVTNNLNALYPSGKTITKVHYSWFLPLNRFRDRRKYLKQRKLFRNYIGRLAPFFPHSGKKDIILLNTEEVASLFHFPSWRVSPVPGVSRVTTRTKAPPILPKE